MKNLLYVALITAAPMSTAHAEDRDMLLDLDLWLCETEVATGLFWNSEEWVAVSEEIIIEDVRWLLRIPGFKAEYYNTEEAQNFGVVEDYESRVAYLDYEECFIRNFDGALREVSCSDINGNAFYFHSATNRFLNAHSLHHPALLNLDQSNRGLGPVLTSGTCEHLTP